MKDHVSGIAMEKYGITMDKKNLTSSCQWDKFKKITTVSRFVESNSACLKIDVSLLVE